MFWFQKRGIVTDQHTHGHWRYFSICCQICQFLGSFGSWPFDHWSQRWFECRHFANVLVRNFASCFERSRWHCISIDYYHFNFDFSRWYYFQKNSSNHLRIQKVILNLKLTMIFHFSSSGNQQCTWKWSRMAVFTWIDHNSRNSSVDHFAILSGISQIPTIGEKQTRRSHQSFGMVSVIFFSWSPFLWKWFHEKNHRPEFSKK